MTHANQLTQAVPTDPKTGLTLPLSKSLGSQELAKHHAMIALELEVIAKKMDRFGWERDRDTAAHDRLVKDWYLGLQDYPLDEIQAGCRAWVLSNPRKMPNEGDILSEIGKIRAAKWHERKHRAPPEPEPEREAPCGPEMANDIMAEAGFDPKRMTKVRA